MTERVKFATQLSPEVLGRLRALADKEGRQIQVLVEEAIESMLEAKAAERPQADAMRVFEASHARFATLYERLAK